MTALTAGTVAVRVRYFNVLANYAGTKRAEMEVPAGTTVRGLLAHLADANPEAFRRALVRDGVITSYLRVFRNEKLVANEAFEATVASGDEFMLFPAIAGGAR